MASEFLLATRSADKAREIREILHAVTRVELQTLHDVGIQPGAAEDDVENFPTFLGNALAKARYFSQLTGRAVLADDSGLMVDALKGAPGVRTKRFAADQGSDRTDVDEANNDLLLEKLRDVPVGERTARYVCAAACVFPDGPRFTAIGTCPGVIAFERKGSGGFGYDPLFLLPALHVTFAQLSAVQKHEHSHRARAFRALAAHLK
ncbi:MAG TPA: non-canonical purine NTP pyrophosphatase [Longimicrobiales bacterium]|nr:non-canonical purine NTP pyrophosphatase [Longimicrobiales bacterium]